MLSADDAKQWGFVTEVVAHDNLATKANELAIQLASGPQGLWRSEENAFIIVLISDESQLDNETRHIVTVGRS